MNDKFTNCAVKYLERKGCEVVGIDAFDGRDYILAYHGSSIRVIAVEGALVNGTASVPTAREFEDAFISFARQHDLEVDAPVVFDFIRIVKINDGAGLARWHTNCLNDRLLTNLEWLAKHDPGALLDMVDPEHHGWLGQIHEVECEGCE